MVRSWDVASDLPAIDVRGVLAAERGELLGFLRTLGRDEWHTDTGCDGWSVHDVALHLLGNDFGRLGAPSPNARAGAEGFMDLAATIERSNDAWVTQARRIAPDILIDLLALTGARVDERFAQVDLHQAGVAVRWTGSGPSPYWLDIAREYTERWVHHAQMREAVGREPLLGRRWLHPVLDAFVRSLPQAYEDVPAPVGTAVSLVVSGEAGDSWHIKRTADRWRLVPEAGDTAAATVEIPADAAWRLLTRTGDVDAARRAARVNGSQELGEAKCSTLPVVARDEGWGTSLMTKTGV